MKIGIIIGSNRDGSQSGRVGDVIAELLGELYAQARVDIFALNTLEVALWSSDKWDPNSEMVASWTPISARLAECDGFVVICPEWAGMATPHLKNFLLMCEGGEMAHKLGLIVSVSAGNGGAYPVAELRMSGYKNTHLWWLPEHIICRNVAELFVEEGHHDSDRLKARIGYCLRFLVESSAALKPVRDKIQDLESYRFGM